MNISVLRGHFQSGVVGGEKKTRTAEDQDEEVAVSSREERVGLPSCCKDITLFAPIIPPFAQTLNPFSICLPIPMEQTQEQLDPEVAQEVISILSKKVTNLRNENSQLQVRPS